MRYDYDPDSGDGLTHMYYTKTPVFPFGWGKSYTTFTYNWTTNTTVTVSGSGSHEIGTASLVLEGAVVEAACTVANTGTRSGDAVVLGFINNASSTEFPRQRLFGFERVALAPGQSVSVPLVVKAEHLSVVDERGVRWLKPGGFTVQVGDVEAPATKVIQLRGAPQLLEDLSGIWSDA